jgi:hypothetical protein
MGLIFIEYAITLLLLLLLSLLFILCILLCDFEYVNDVCCIFDNVCDVDGC